MPRKPPPDPAPPQPEEIPTPSPDEPAFTVNVQAVLVKTQQRLQDTMTENITLTVLLEQERDTSNQLRRELVAMAAATATTKEGDPA